MLLVPCFLRAVAVRLSAEHADWIVPALNLVGGLFPDAVRRRPAYRVAVPREVTARDLADLGDERFEQLVASLVFAEEPDAEKPSAPDGGADVLVPARRGWPARIWQVKHYPDAISWSKCEKSLDDAVKNYDPEKVVFVFPRNLSASRRRDFEQRLVARHPDVDVRHWGLTHIQERLAANADIAQRYFGDKVDDVLPAVLRAVAQGGKELQTTRDLADRAFALADFADTVDPSFEYVIRVGASVDAPVLTDNPPFMVIQELRGKQRLRTEAHLRPEANAAATAGFTDDEAGARARERAREGLAAGEEVELTDGVWLQVENPPVVVKEAYESIAAEGFDHTSTRMLPGEPTMMTVTLGTGEDALSRSFAVRPIPPRPGHHLSFGAIVDGLALFADFEPGTLAVHLNLGLSTRPARNPAINAAAARFQLAFLQAEAVACEAPGLLPDGGLTVAGDATAAVDAEAVTHLRLSIELHEALTVIEQHVGPVDVPEEMTRGEFDEVLTAALVLKTGRATVSITELVMDIDHAGVDHFLTKASAGHPSRIPLRVPIFGQQVLLGLAEFETPQAEFFTKEQSPVPGKTRVRLRTHATSIPFRLVTDDQNGAAEARARPSRIWTPQQGPAHLLYRL